MRKPVIFIFCTLFVLMTVNSNCQELLYYKSLQTYDFGLKNRIQNPSRGGLLTNSKYLVSKPGYTKFYEWIDNSWAHQTNSTYTYNEKGMLIEEEMNIMVPGDTKYKLFWVYDIYDNLIEYTVHHWINKNWEIYLSQKIYITYDASGNILEVMSQVFEDNVWINFWKTAYELGDQGEWISYIEYVWEDEAWVNDLKYLDIVWHSWSNFQLESYFAQTWDNGWVNTDKYFITYNENNYNRICEKYDGENWIFHARDSHTFSESEEVDLYEIYEDEMWMNNEKYTSTYDEYGSMTRYTNEYWEEEDWVIDLDVKYLLTYNSNNDIEIEIVQLWDTSYQLWYNIQKFVNYDFQYFELGVEQNVIEVPIHIYPNPTTNTLSLNFKEEIINEVVVQIFNVEGQKVFEEKLMGIQNKIDVNVLPKGMYILQLNLNEKNVIHQKFLKL